LPLFVVLPEEEADMLANQSSSFLRRKRTYRTRLGQSSSKFIGCNNKMEFLAAARIVDDFTSIACRHKQQQQQQQQSSQPPLWRIHRAGRSKVVHVGQKRWVNGMNGVKVAVRFNPLARDLATSGEKTGALFSGCMCVPANNKTTNKLPSTVGAQRQKGANNCGTVSDDVSSLCV
jgi:hypothetical protein